MKIFFVNLFLLMSVSCATAQSISPSVLASNGDYFIGSNGSLSWTLGETATEFLSTGTSQLSQGYQQSSFSGCVTLPAAPASITQTLVSNTCGARVYRYTVSSVAGAIGYIWSIPLAVGGVPGMMIDSGNVGSSAVIKVKYVSNAAAFATDSVRVFAYNTCGFGKAKSGKLINTVLNPPAAPASVTITNVQTNICGARIYRYTAPNLPVATTTTTAATDWQWSLIGALSAFASLDSGTWTSQVIRIKYTSNEAAIAGDSILLKYGSACGNSLKKAAKLTNTLLSPPIAPASITITPVQTNICGARIYRYTAPALPAATAANGAATGWKWTLLGSLSATAVVDSGSLTDQVVRIRFASNSAAATGDSILLRYNSTCGLSPYRAAKLTNTSLATVMPASITITPVQTNVCGARIYRYSAPALVTASATTAESTGWLWSWVGSLGATAVLDSGNLNSQVIRLRFSSNAAAATGDSILLRYNSLCGYGSYKSVKFTNTLLTSALPASIIAQAVQTNVCGARIYRYTAPVLPAATATAPASTGYQWYLPTGPVGSTGVLDSGLLTGRYIRIRYSSNDAAAAGDSIRLAYISLCGTGSAKALKLTNTATVAPIAPISITQQLVTNLCNATVYRYIAPNLTSASTSAVAANGWEWGWTGTLGASVSIDSGTVFSQKIKLKFSSNTAATIGDSIKLRFTTICTPPSIWRASLFTYPGIPGCPSSLPVSKDIMTDHSLSKDILTAEVYPNPSSNQFYIKWSSHSPSPVIIRVFDAKGRLLIQKNNISTKVVGFGNELSPGTYLLEILKEEQVVRKKIIKQ